MANATLEVRGSEKSGYNWLIYTDYEGPEEEIVGVSNDLFDTREECLRNLDLISSALRSHIEFREATFV